jgi:hypothetical protein
VIITVAVAPKALKPRGKARRKALRRAIGKTRGRTRGKPEEKKLLPPNVDFDENMS